MFSLSLFSSPYALFLLLLLALIIGSFLNVVIYRLPLILMKNWRAECLTFLNEIQPEPLNEQHLSLAWPSSHCPHCKTPLKPWHNIPLFSYIWLRGRCHQCKQGISFRYPLIEILSVLLTFLAYYQAGWSLAGLYLMVGGLLLLVLTFIDLDTQFLPDGLNYTFLWLGLAANTQGLFASLPDAIYGAIAGYLILWIVSRLFLLLRKKEGMGHGDFKLLAGLGAWLGWQYLLPVLLFSSFFGALIGIICILSGRLKREQPIPFGPFLASAGWFCMFYGKPLLEWWIR